MKVEEITRLEHPEFRICAQMDDSGHMMEVFLVPKQSGLFKKTLSTALVKNTPEDGVLALLERYWELEKKCHHPLPKHFQKRLEQAIRTAKL